MGIDPGAAAPLYQQVALDIRRKILSGEMPVGSQLQPHRELAVSYDVSLITINKALSGLVSEGILHSRVGRGTFVASRPADPESSTPTSVLGFVLRDLSSPFFSLVAHAAQQRADELGYGVLFSSSSNRIDREDEQIRRFCDLGVSGLIIASMSRTYRISESIQTLHDRGFPYVMVSYTDGADVPFVGMDLDSGGYLATQHMLAMGRQRIGYVGDKFGSIMCELRGRGYKRALEQAGLLEANQTFQFEYPFEGEWNDYRSGYAVAEQVANLPVKPDGMFVFNDLGALGFQDGLLDRGIRVPEDIAVVGLDDIELAGRARIPLTTVRQPVDRIGAIAVDTILARLRGETPPIRQILPPELIVRRSSGAAIADQEDASRFHPTQSDAPIVAASA
ncbi:MAG TPA: GntR family transcriptional regulator [Gemmatimonadaceae bacterium]|nr:GntR family transcriptional regulator [Gemmatimonadaceae bacterium]